MRTILVCIIFFSCLVIGCKGFAFKTPTENMLPTIKTNETFIVNQYSSFEIKRFDIVMLKAPKDITKSTKDSDIRIISRVIGLPNDKLEIKDSKIYINNILLDEPFEKINNDEDFKKSFGPIIVPENQYFMLGDNRPNSFDSRFWKKPTIPREDIVGKVLK